MSYTYVTINDLTEVDFDDIYERSKDAIETNWPTGAETTSAQKKEIVRSNIQSCIDGTWAGTPPLAEDDRFLMFKIVDQLGTVMGLVSGFVTANGTFDGKNSLSAPAADGSRNYIYSQQNKLARDQYYRDNGISYIKYNNLHVDSPMYKFLKLRANAGNYDIVSDEETFPGFRTLVTAPRL
jgi:hypothetical protein